MSKYIDKVLFEFATNFAQYHDDQDGAYWWGHDTNLGKQTKAFSIAKRAINRYKREQTPAKSKLTPRAMFSIPRRKIIAEAIFGKGKVPVYWSGSTGEYEILEKLASVKSVNHDR